MPNNAALSLYKYDRRTVFWEQIPLTSMSRSKYQYQRIHRPKLCSACNKKIQKPFWPEHRQTCGRSSNSSPSSSSTQPATPSTIVFCYICKSDVRRPSKHHRLTCGISSSSPSSSSQPAPDSDNLTCFGCNKVVQKPCWYEHARNCVELYEYICSPANQKVHKRNAQQIADKWTDANRVLGKLKAPDPEVGPIETTRLPPMRTWLHLSPSSER
ncbi:hypothetical protein WG66_011177 [Moniliophthora roreri]|nr:hypothetical protein WG66_011177 [Moniliophthora roreri]